MACAGALTSIIMTAVGAFIANGGLAEVFGGAPVAGAAGSAAEGLVTVYTPSGEIFSMSTAEAVASGIIENTASQSWFSGLGGLGDTLNSMTNSFLEFTAPMREAWSSLATAPAAAGKEVFNSVSGVWGPKQHNLRPRSQKGCSRPLSHKASLGLAKHLVELAR